jgi:hypothetical protein
MSFRSLGDRKPSGPESSYWRAHATNDDLTRDLPLAEVRGKSTHRVSFHRARGNGPPPGLSAGSLATAASPQPGAPSWLFAERKRLGDGEVAIGAVRNHSLTRLKTELGAIELY